MKQGNQPEPECVSNNHDWRNPHEVVGGLKENPGVRGHGGGVIMTEVCSRCGMYRRTDTWYQDPRDGRLWGEDRITYEGADEKSEAWIERMLG